MLYTDPRGTTVVQAIKKQPKLSQYHKKQGFSNYLNIAKTANVHISTAWCVAVETAGCIGYAFEGKYASECTTLLSLSNCGIDITVRQAPSLRFMISLILSQKL
jgi:hypothetical protein